MTNIFMMKQFKILMREKLLVIRRLGKGFATQLFNIVVNDVYDFGGKKFAVERLVLVISELVVTGTQCTVSRCVYPKIVCRQVKCRIFLK